MSFGGDFIQTIEVDGDNSDTDSNASASSSEDSNHTKDGTLLRKTYSADSMRMGSKTNSSSKLAAAGTAVGGKLAKRFPGQNAPPRNDGDLTEDQQRDLTDELFRAAENDSANLGNLALHLNPARMMPVKALSNLKELFLSENELPVIPDEVFANMKLLEKVDLTNNQLAKIPESLMTLQRLHTLLVDHNALTTVPQTWDPTAVMSLPNLKVLGLEWNKLSEFPTHIFDIAPVIEKIFLCENIAVETLFPPSVLESPVRAGVPLSIRLDNRPKLQQLAEGLPEGAVTINWNKIFPDKVCDYCFLGSLRTAQCTEVYDECDIKYVLTAGRQLDVVLGENMVQLELAVDDLPGEDLTPFFETTYDFIDKAILEKRGVLIHCFAGLSRSVTVMVAYLMKKEYPMTRDAALIKIRNARPNACPNDGFMKHLLGYEKTLRAKRGDAPA